MNRSLLDVKLVKPVSFQHITVLICTYKYLEALKEAASEGNAPQRTGSGASQTAVNVNDGGTIKLSDGESGSSCVYHSSCARL